MDVKEKRKQYQRDWVAAKRLATSKDVPTKNATCTEMFSGNDSVDKYANLIKPSENGQDMSVEDAELHRAESGVSGDETWVLMKIQLFPPIHCHQKK